MVDLKSKFQKLADVGAQLKEGLEDRARNLKEGAQDKVFEKRLERFIHNLGSGPDGERAAAAAELLAMTRERSECRDQVMKAYLTSLPNQPAGAQWAIIESLQELMQDHPELVEDLREAIRSCLTSPHKVVRLRLYEIWTAEARDTNYRKTNLADMLSGLRDPNNEVRYAVADHLLKLSRSLPKTIVQIADKALTDDEWMVSYHGARLAAAIARPHPELIEPLTAHLEQALRRDSRTHGVVIEALGLVGTYKPSTVAPMIDLLISKLSVVSMNIQRAGATALGRIGGIRPKLVMGASERLMRMLDDDEWMVHPPVLRAIGRIGYHHPEWFSAKFEHIEKLARGGVDPEVTRAARWARVRLEGTPAPPVFKPRPRKGAKAPGTRGVRRPAK